MRVQDIPAVEDRIVATGLAHLSILPFTHPSAADAEIQISGYVCRRKDARATYYYQEVHPKDRIVLHFTAGNLRGDLLTLTGEQHVSVAYVISRNGTLFQLFPPDYWSYHLGPGAFGGNKLQSKRTIAIELSNYGPLIPNGTELDTIYSTADRRDRYCSLEERDAFVFLDKPFRERQYFASHTRAQYSTLVKLLRHLTVAFDIPADFLPPTRRYQAAADVCEFMGIVSHINYRSAGKWDIGPAFDWDGLVNRVQAVSPDPDEHGDARGWFIEPAINSTSGMRTLFESDTPYREEVPPEEMEPGYNPLALQL